MPGNGLEFICGAFGEDGFVADTMDVNLGGHNVRIIRLCTRSIGLMVEHFLVCQVNLVNGLLTINITRAAGTIIIDTRKGLAVGGRNAPTEVVQDIVSSLYMEAFNKGT